MRITLGYAETKYAYSKLIHRHTLCEKFSELSRYLIPLTRFNILFLPTVEAFYLPSPLARYIKILFIF